MMSEYRENKTIPLFETFCRKQQVDGKTVSAKICGRTLELTVASTPRSQAKGFMGATEEPKENEGMLFVYDRDLPLSFWMKNVPFALDVVFFDSNMQYVGHETMQPYKGEPEELLPHYFSQKPARFAVELKSGWCEQNLKDEATLSF